MSERDFLSESAALDLADRLIAFWAARGFAVSARVERVKFQSAVRHVFTAPVFGVRSDMINGWPTRRLGGVG
jgi:hypothetical protein